MAAKQEEQQLTGDGFTSHIVGMSKSQLYDIMCQMKGLIDQNQQQARQILIDNPLLTRALFQAQIMLGMVKPSQAVPKIQQAVSQPQSAQVGTQSNAAEMTKPSAVQVGVQSEASLPQLPIPARPSASSNLAMPPKNPLQTSAFVNSIAPPQSSSQLHNVMPSSQSSSSHLHNVMPSSQSSSSQLHNVMPASQSSSSQLHNVMPASSGPPHYSHIPMVSGHSLQAPPGLLHQPLPQHLRPPSMQPFAHQMHQMPPGLGFQPSQLYFPQSLFHSGVNPSASFTQRQAPLQSQHHLQQGFPSSSSMHPDRGGHWAAEAGGQFTGGQMPQAFFWGQMPQATGGNPPPLPPDVEKALLQQVMSLTPEQISLLPPEQRHQVIQLQEMLR